MISGFLNPEPMDGSGFEKRAIVIENTSAVYQTWEPRHPYPSFIDPGRDRITLKRSQFWMISAYGIFRESSSVAFIQLFIYSGISFFIKVWFI